MKKRDSFFPSKSYRENPLSSELRQALESFLDVIAPLNSSEWRPSRSQYSYGVAKKYVHISNGIFLWRVSPTTGNLFHWRKKGGSYGNIHAIVAAAKAGKKISWDGNSSIVIAGNECGVCRSDKHVMRTVVGPRCSRCRSVDSRHIGAIRQLGGVPNADGRPFREYVLS